MNPINVSVEAELGKIGGTEGHVHVDDKDAIYTDADEAKYFVEKTGIKSLAIAIGTAQGQYKGEPKLDLERLIKILTGIPLVLQVSSGVPDETVKKAITLGIRKEILIQISEKHS